MTLPFASQPADIERFLASSETWGPSSRLGYGWRGTKFLGKGAFGVTGLWEFQGDEEFAPPLRQVVVKMSQRYDQGMQQPGVPPKSMLVEGEMLEKISRLRNGHVIRSFGGNRLGDRYEEMDDVVKTFLEFCPGGNGDKFLPESNAEEEEVAGEGLEEYDIWQIFNCLAEGICIIAQAMQETTGYGAGGMRVMTRELVHFDLKPDNIFFGFKDEDHPRLPIAKLADFGEATDVIEMSRQDDEYGGTLYDRGMEDFRAPEEMYVYKFSEWDLKKYPLTHPRKGNCTNIWQLGAIMNCILTRRRVNFNPRRVEKYYPNPLGTSSRPHCSEILKREFNHSQYLEPGLEIRDWSAELEEQRARKEREEANKKKKVNKWMYIKSGIGLGRAGSGKKRKRDSTSSPSKNPPIAGKNYSTALLNIIQECLLREPLLRPTPSQLFARTQAGLARSKQALVKQKITLPELPFKLGEITAQEPYSVEPPLNWDPISRMTTPASQAMSTATAVSERATERMRQGFAGSYTSMSSVWSGGRTAGTTATTTPDGSRSPSEEREPSIPLVGGWVIGGADYPGAEEQSPR